MENKECCSAEELSRCPSSKVICLRKTYGTPCNVQDELLQVNSVIQEIIARQGTLPSSKYRWKWGGMILPRKRTSRKH